MSEKKPYVPPQLYEVALDQEQAILATCSLATMSASAGGNVGCRAPSGCSIVPQRQSLRMQALGIAGCVYGIHVSRLWSSSIIGATWILPFASVDTWYRFRSLRITLHSYLAPPALRLIPSFTLSTIRSLCKGGSRCTSSRAADGATPF